MEGRDQNEGLKGPRWDQDQDFVSQDQDRDQDIKTESRDVSRPRLESRELHRLVGAMLKWAACTTDHFDWFIDWLVDWLIDWLTDWLIDWFFPSFIFLHLFLSLCVRNQDGQRG